MGHQQSLEAEHGPRLKRKVGPSDLAACLLEGTPVREDKHLLISELAPFGVSSQLPVDFHTPRASYPLLPHQTFSSMPYSGLMTWL